MNNLCKQLKISFKIERKLKGKGRFPWLKSYTDYKKVDSSEEIESSIRSIDPAGQNSNHTNILDNIIKGNKIIYHCQEVSGYDPGKSSQRSYIQSRYRVTPVLNLVQEAQ